MEIAVSATTTTTKNTAPPRFLDLVPDADRSHVAGRFYAAARRGVSGASPLCRAVFVEARDAGDDLLVTALRADPQRALDYADYVIQREGASPEERERMKAETREEGMRRVMSGKPASAKQVAFLRKLGEHAVPKSMLEASAMIDAALKRERRL
jgi:hypothetical protein